MTPSPLLATPGAVPAEGVDLGVAAHYGDPFAEQRGTVGGLGLVDRSNRGVIRIAGPDRLSWLHNLTTQSVEHLAPGDTAEALILNPQGHVEHHLVLTDDGSTVWAHVEPGTAGPLLEFLESMRFMLRVDPADVSADYGILTLMGPGRPDPPGAAAATLSAPFQMDLVVAREELAGLAAGLRSGG